MYDSSRKLTERKLQVKENKITSLVYRLPFENYQVTNLPELTYVKCPIRLESEWSKSSLNFSFERVLLSLSWCYIYGRMAETDSNL